MNEFLTLKEIAGLLRVREETVRTWVAKNTFPQPIKISGTQRWSATAVRTFLDKGGNYGEN